ncbi:MAG: putative transrane protein [Ramlibacter sp.]|nr:putative transrane protein [Ramlibacter sp.]
MTGPSSSSTSRSSLQAALAAVVAAVALFAWSAPAFAAWDLQQLMDSLAHNKSGRATFVETKRIAMLDRPIESSGELLYTAPDRLEKRTLKPKPESMIVQGSELVVDRGGRSFRVQLDAQPQLAAFIDSIRGTLAGDRKALERSYRLSLEGTQQNWVLQLVPVENRMRGVIKQIRVAGVQDQVKSVEISQADGDSSLMTIEKSNAPP